MGKNKTNIFRDRKILIATQHNKEKVIAPLLEKAFGLQCIVPQDFNTDLLGTFTGEVERKADPVSTARMKCRMAMQQYHADLALASEGSFGPHPLLFFVPSDEETVMLCDSRNDLEIIERELSTETNFRGTEIHSQIELMDFAASAGFPDHGLILRKSRNDNTEIIKGITNREELINTYLYLKTHYGSTFAETDMRAMYNPTRMKIIEKATQKLIKKINSLCPNCRAPGFGITSFREGLPCGLCNFPTRSVFSHLYICSKCSFTKEVKYPHKKKTEDPMYCDRCNP